MSLRISFARERLALVSRAAAATRQRIIVMHNTDVSSNKLCSV